MNQTQRSLLLCRYLAPAALLAVGAPAWAHAGHGDLSHFVDAAVHPWTGIDHVLSALVTGMVGAHVGGRKGAAVLLAYLAGLFVGTLADGSVVPWLESALGLSIAVMSLVLLLPAMAGAGLATCLAAVFAVLHGQAHFMEVSHGAGAVVTVGGLVLSTGLLLFSGLGLQVILQSMGIAGRRVAWPLAAVGTMLVLKTF